MKNPTKNFITSIVFLFCFSISNQSFAQFGKLLDKTKTKTKTNNTTTTTTATQSNGKFREGDRVEVNYRAEWRKGTVIQMSSAGRVQVSLDGAGPMWVEANNVRAINEPNRADEKNARIAKRPFKEGDVVELTNENGYLSFGKVTGIPNETQINVHIEGSGPIVLNNVDAKPSIPSTGKYKVGEKVAVVGLGGYEMATISAVSKSGYSLTDANINVNQLWHEKNLYKFDEQQFNTVTKPIADLLERFEFANSDKPGYLQFTGAEAKDALDKLAAARTILQPQKLNLPLTPVYQWKKNPNYTLYLLQQTRNLLYLDICSGDTTMTASELLKNNLQNAYTEAVLEKNETGGYPKDYSKYFVSTKGYENFMAEWKTWAKNREDVLAVLGKPEKNDWTSVKPVFEKKNAEYMTKLAIYSKTYDLNIVGQNATYEAMARKTLQTQYPNLKILKSWLTRNDFVVRKDSYNIPTVKFMFVHFLCTSPDYKTQIHTSVELTADYSNGKYGALYTKPASKEQYWGRIGDFVLGK